MEYHDDLEYELYNYSDEEEDDDLFDLFTLEDWQDWYSEELLNLWFHIVEYHDFFYEPLRKTYNEFTLFVLGDDDEFEEFITPEVQGISNNPFIRDRDWRNFFVQYL
jgi:hypothetical protein